VIVYAIVDASSSRDRLVGNAVETFVRREDAERFLEDVRRDAPEVAKHLRIVERKLGAGGQN
jgi:hypothetical protein